MSASSQPNILLIVLDACRLDYVKEHAPNLCKLGDDSVWFENAIAPATWTQPSHASVFTGQYPHDHGVTQPSQSEAPTDLVEQIAEYGYSTHGVSGNGFVSPLWDFDRAFDSFRYTQTPEPFPSGMDTYTFLRNQVDTTSKANLLFSAGRASLSHDHPVKSLANLASVGTNAVARNFLPPLTRIPHPVFAPNPQHSYSPEKNTTLIQKTIRRQTSSDRPFFLFTNYMDTHRPYQAPDDLQKKHLGEKLSKQEFERLNDDVAAPWEFIKQVQNDDVDEGDMEKLRQLYAASVESVDRHINRIIETLEEAGIREETLIIVTGDHGENLGKEDNMGRRRFGHEASISDSLARVPLLISHPSIENGTVEDLISVKDIFELQGLASDPEVPMEEVKPRDLASKRVICEYPALADKGFHNRYPDIDRNFLRQRVSMDSVAVYEDEWRVVAESDGTRHAEQAGNSVGLDSVPEALLEFVEVTLEQVNELQHADVSSKTAEHLEDLGYV